MSTIQRIISEVKHRGAAKSITRTIINRTNININPKEQSPSLYVCVTYAQTLDGCIGIAIASTNTNTNTSTNTSTNKNADEQEAEAGIRIGSSSNLKLSCPESFLLTHALRANFDAIIVGGNTLSTDNPRLNNRLWNMNGNGNGNGNGNHGQHQQESKDKDDTTLTLKQPIPVILDSNLRHVISMIESNQIINCAKSHEFIIICCRESAYEQYYEKVEEYCNVHNVSIKLQVCDCDCIEIKGEGGGSISKRPSLSLKHVLQRLGENHGIESVMVEGGASIISSFLEQRADLVDCVCVTICPRFAGSKGLNALRSALITGTECEGDGEGEGDEDGDGMLEFKSSNWFQLGQDSIFLAF